MKIGMNKDTFEPQQSWQKKMKEAGLKEKIKLFDVFSCGATAQSKFESDPNCSKELEKKIFS